VNGIRGEMGVSRHSGAERVKRGKPGRKWRGNERKETMLWSLSQQRAPHHPKKREVVGTEKIRKGLGLNLEAEVGD